MTAFSISILQDEAGGEAGYAHIRLVGVPSLPPDGPPAGLTLLIRSAEGAGGLGPSGWGARAEPLPAARQLYRQGTLDLTVGPRVVDHVPAGARIVLEVPALSVAEELEWPRLAASPRRSPGQGSASPSGARSTPNLSAGAAAESSSTAPSSGLRARRRSEPVRRAPTIGHRENNAARTPVVAAAHASGHGTRGVQAKDAEADHRRDRRHPRPKGGGMALPWKITLVNLVLMAGLFVLGYLMVFQGVDPLGSLLGGGGRQMAEQNLRDTVDPRTAIVLDVLATTEVGPVDAARTTLAGGATPHQAYEYGAEFLGAGAPEAALSLFELAAETGHGPAHTAIGRMADPLTFATDTSAFSRPNAELAIDWYRRGLAAGDATAEDALLTLRLWLEQRAAEGDLDARNALLLFQERG